MITIARQQVSTENNIMTSGVKEILLLVVWLSLTPMVSTYLTSPPTWLTSPLFRAGNNAVISSYTGSGTNPQYTFTFSSPLSGTPSLAYGMKGYRGNDFMMQQYNQIRKIGLTSSTFSVEVQIYGVTNLWILNVPYLAVDPNFPYHFNSFDNVPVNYSSGNIVNISVAQSYETSFTEVIDYSKQAKKMPFNTFSQPLSSNKIVLFITSIWIAGTKNKELKIRINPAVLNETHYQWTATAYLQVMITRFQFSQVIFNQAEVESSATYYIVYEEWTNDMNGGFKSIPYEFVDNFIMALTDFDATNANCGFEYQWQFSNDTNGTFGVEVLLSWTIRNTCGFSESRSSILYMMTWSCPPAHPYFNLTTSLCQDVCSNYFEASNSSYTCNVIPCQTVCLNCSITNVSSNVSESQCLECDTSLYYQLVNGSCECILGYSWDGNNCTEVCGDGLVHDHECDDNNTIDGDGCSSNCTVETYWNCTNGTSVSSSSCFEICGDGYLVYEECDDGNLVDYDGCSSNCTFESGFVCDNTTNPTQCNQTCGDGFLFVEPCDDNNTIDGDGCSAGCQIQPGYVCQNGTYTTKSDCYPGTSNITLTQFWKDPNANAAVITLQFDNLISSIADNIEQFLTLGFPYETVSYQVDNSTGQVMISFTYNQSLNGGQTLAVDYTIGTSVTSTQLGDTDNNLALKYYDQNVYSTQRALSKITEALSYAASGIFILGLAVSRLISIQMIFVFQFTYSSLATLKKMQALMQPLTYLWITNGPNYLMRSGDNTLPTHLKEINLYNKFFANFNLNIFFLLTPILIGLVLCLMGCLCKSNKVVRAGRIALTQWLLSGCLFCVFQFVFAFVITIRYDSQHTFMQLIVSSAIWLVVITVTIAFKCTSSPDFGEYKSFFDHGYLCKLFYIFIIIARVLIAGLMIAFNDSFFSTGPIIGILVIWGLVLIFMQPYYTMTRPILNYLMVLAICCLILYSKTQIDSQQVNAASYVSVPIIVILLLCLLFNGYFLITYMEQYCCREKSKGRVAPLKDKHLTLEEGINTFASKVSKQTGSQVTSQFDSSQTKFAQSPNKSKVIFDISEQEEQDIQIDAPPKRQRNFLQQYEGRKRERKFLADRRRRKQ